MTTNPISPMLELHLTTGALGGRVAFTRAGATATRVNSIGRIEALPADTPRFDYDSVTGVCKGLLIEEARTNGIRNSSNISSADWTRNNISVSLSETQSPDGSNNAHVVTVTDAFDPFLEQNVPAPIRDDHGR